ncbi:MAG: AMP-binding protein [Thermodesulfovibrionales bacterium]
MSNRKFLTISEGFFNVTESLPDDPVFHYYRDGWKTLTYRGFANGVAALASYLVRLGLKRGGKVAIISENRPEWCAAYLATVLAGGVAVPIDAQLGPDEVGNLLKDCGADIVFHSQKTLVHIGAHLINISEALQKSIALLDFDSTRYESALREKSSPALPETGPDDVASIIYTSGTTGNPKGVVLTHSNFCSDAEALIGAGIVSPEDNVLSVLPLHHTYAFMCTFLVPLFLGASITYPASLKGPDLMSAIKDRGVSVLIGVPQLLAMIRNGIFGKIEALPAPASFVLLKILRLSGFLRERAGINIGRIFFASAHRALGPKFRFFGSGGARLDPAVMKDLEALGFMVLEGYGLTETSPVVTFNPVSGRRPGSAGKPLPSVRIRIAGPSEKGEGEIEIKGPMVMKGYYRDPSATADVLRDGWFRTGDIGRIDGEGYLFITGRSKEVIVLSSGKNIYPEDVEKVYLSSPLIKEICIVGIGEKGLTETLHAVIVPDLEYTKKARTPDLREAIKWEMNEMSSKIPSYMRVTGFSIRTGPLPRTPLGKLRRFMIREEAAGPVTEGREREAGGDIFADETAQKVAESLKRFVKGDRRIGPSDNIELDIGLDSLAKIELVVALEKAFSIRLPENFMADIQTVKELIAKVRAQASPGYSPGTSEKGGWRDILAGGPSETNLGMPTIEGPDNRMIPSFVAHSLLKCLFRVLFRLEARGAENLPQGKNFILASNHTSYLDGFAVILSLPFVNFKNTYSLGLSEFFTGFLKSRFAKIAHVIPIDSSAYLNKALQMSAYVIKNGRSLSVFPEGGRSFDGSLLEFKKGVGILAVELGVNVVPVYVEGTLEALPRGTAFPRPGKITVTFGRPLLARDLDFSKKPSDVDEYQYFADVLREKVGELMVSTKRR